MPPNIELVFIPPYTPELNPAEKIWRYLKDRVANKVHETLDDLSDAVASLVTDLSEITIKSITSYSCYVDTFTPNFKV